MRKPEELKTVRKTVLMSEATANDIEQEAKERGISPNAVMNERLKHRAIDFNPEKLAKFQDFVNQAIRLMGIYSIEKAKFLAKEAHKLWIFSLKSE